MSHSREEARRALSDHDQEHVLAFWDSLDEKGRSHLIAQIESIDFELMERLIAKWVLDEPPAERFREITPVPTISQAEPTRADAREARDAGEEALRLGRVGLLLVAGGQGTRLGFDGPKGAYPIGPVTKRSLFAYHSDKLHNAQDRYGCTLPWYIMVSDTNEAATRAFFRENGHFGLHESQIKFFRQRMAPCVDERGKFMLEEPGSLAMNPNGHGGVIPAIVENGIARDARERGVDILSYFQVDNWAIKAIDPYFIGYHVLRGGEMSSKIHRKREPREAVGVHCLCDGEYRVIEYSELDIYPQLLETTSDGLPRYYAGNPAMHILSMDFVERVNAHFMDFPWHRAHKKIAYVGADGRIVKPHKPNGYKFETFVFDALRFIRHKPVALEIGRLGEYTPIKSFEGDNSVVAAWASMREYWGGWLESAGYAVPRNEEGNVAVEIEISPRFASSCDEFVAKASKLAMPANGSVVIDSDGAVR